MYDRAGSLGFLLAFWFPLASLSVLASLPLSLCAQIL
jgi:hypothetical protein